MCLHFRPYFSVSSFHTHSYNLARTLPQRDTPSSVAAGGNGQGKAELEGQGALWGSAPSSRQVFIVGHSRQSGWAQDRILVRWSMLLPNRKTRAVSCSSPALLSLGGGGEGNRNGRWSKKGTQAAFSLHSTFPELQENKALATFWKDITEEEIRIIIIAII